MFNIMNNHLLHHFHSKKIDTRTNIIKREQQQKYSQFGYTPQQLTEIIIEPIHVKKQNNSEIVQKYNELKQKYTIDNTNKYKANTFIQELWNKRTNIPYKKILNDMIQNKDIKSAEDLIIYKPSLSDKDYNRLMQDYNNLIELRKKHNIELTNEYSEVNKNEHIKKFEYSTTYIRSNFNPKDYTQLKSSIPQHTNPHHNKIKITKKETQDPVIKQQESNTQDPVIKQESNIKQDHNVVHKKEHDKNKYQQKIFLTKH